MPKAVYMPVIVPPDVTIVEADCLTELRGIGDDEFEAVIADPPYGVSFQSAWKTKTERFARISGDNAPFVWWLWDAFRVTKLGGCLLCFCRWDSAEAFRQAIGWAGYVGQTQLIWDRCLHGMGDPSSRPSPRHDTIWFAAKGRYQIPGVRPTSVLRHARLSGTQLLHPNQKPVELLRQLVREYVPVGGRVLDPFVGCGTGAVAAKLEGRGCLGIEIDPQYVTIANKRLRGEIA